MSAASAASQRINVIGGPLTLADYATLQRSGISKATADRALIRRVDSATGADIVGRNGSADYSGLAFPYMWPGIPGVREYRLRRDNPEIENGKPRQRYMAPPGGANMLYFAPGTRPEWLADPSIPIVLTEGEKKCLALSEIAWCGLSDSAEKPQFVPVAISGVQNWRGKIGKVGGPNGERLNRATK